MNKTSTKPFNKPIDNGILTMLRHQAYLVSRNQMLSSIKTIELAARCDYPHLARIVKDAYHSYNDVQQLIKYFTLFGIDPHPDQSWNQYDEMRKEFNRTSLDMLSQLNDEATTKLKDRGIIQ